MLLQASLAVLIGLIGLVWSADRFVAGAAATARNLGMAPILIGLTIVSLGTSAPEIFVSVNAALSDSSAMAVGNAIGSNIANIALVLGATLVIASIPVTRLALKREAVLLLITTAIGAYCLHDNYLSRIDSAILLVTLVAVFGYLIAGKSHDPHNPGEDDEIPVMTMGKAIFWLVIGIFFLVVSSQALVWGAKTIALDFGISELVIGLTIVAIGTSLPELAASVASALKGHHDIALGNILGSNLLNILAVMSVPALINPTHLPVEAFNRDYMSMIALTCLLVLMMAVALFLKKGHKTGQLKRWEGFILLAAYLGYTWMVAPLPNSL